MTTGATPYVVPDAVNDSTVPGVFETVIIARTEPVEISPGVQVNAETYNGAIPGPTIRVDVGDTVIVRLINDLSYPTGIHWHGIELQSSADGTPVTQDGARVGPFPKPSPASPSGGTYLYKFKVPRAGIFWYHPHHSHSTNRVFRGLYGLIIVTDPSIEAPLVAAGTIPASSNTHDVVLSDVTRCQTAGMNDSATYVDPSTMPAGTAPEWLSGSTSQPGPTPEQLCELAPLDDAGNSGGPPFGADAIPNIFKKTAGRVNEGQVVLTNGMNVGPRPGTPGTPGSAAGASKLGVEAGSGVRLRIVNSAVTRYFRLKLTTQSGADVPLIRIGGEGGLLDHAIQEGGSSVGPGSFDFRYETGETLLPPATRADVVAVIPAGEGVGDVLTLWTRDFERMGGGTWAQIPTVPVMHLEVTGTAVVPFSITGGVPGGPAGTALRAAIPDLTETLGPADGVLLDPMAFPATKKGMPDQDIQLTTNPGGPAGINGFQGSFPGSPYTSIPNLDSTRWAEPGRTLELTVTNSSNAHHPFHLHGFSMQPISLTRPGVAGAGSFTWPFAEFRDVINVPAQHTLTFRVRLDDRPLADGVTLGGNFGRWLFHCHIFFHAHNGMISELVVSEANGREKPYVDVGGSWAYAPIGGTALRRGTYHHPDGLPITLSAILDDGTPIGTVNPTTPGEWEWTLNSMGMLAQTTYVYIQAEDSDGRKEQAPFRLKIGAPDDGSDSGDPHIHTVDGTRYDFQAVGEFTLLEDREGLEVQARQTAVPTQRPISDPHTGIAACVSVNTAVAARVGTHTVAYQAVGDGELQFFVDGEPSRLATDGLHLDGNLVTGFDADGVSGMRIDYGHHAVVTVTPRFWSAHGVWYMNVAVAHTQAESGLMGRIRKGSWLPRLRSGADLGPKPADPAERHRAVYEVFADSWRVTDDTSMFVYAPGTSTSTFTDRSWPRLEEPCELSDDLGLSMANVFDPIPTEQAEEICAAVTDPDFSADCIADVSATGDREFAAAYEFAQELRRKATAVQVTGDLPQTKWLQTAWFTVQVTGFVRDCTPPRGTVQLLVGGKAMGRPTRLDARGQARIPVSYLGGGEHMVFAIYDSGDSELQSSRSPAISHFVTRRWRLFDLLRPRIWVKRLVRIVPGPNAIPWRN